MLYETYFFCGSPMPNTDFHRHLNLNISPQISVGLTANLLMELPYFNLLLYPTFLLRSFIGNVFIKETEVKATKVYFPGRITSIFTCRSMEIVWELVAVVSSYLEGLIILHYHRD